MYPTYVVRTAPATGRCVARHAPKHARALSSGPSSGFLSPALFGARHHPFFGTPTARPRNDVFDHFDDFVNRSFDGFFPPGALNVNRSAQVWQPRFDVQEVEGAYQLRGELPGVEAKDLEVEFTNANTLVIRGQTQTERTEGQPQQQQVEAAPEQQEPSMATAENAANAQQAEKDDSASVHSESSYVKPSVENEADAERRESVGTETTAEAPGAATPQTDSTVAQQQPQERQTQKAQPQQPRYWVSERSTGSFSRTFEFPGRVDAEAVTASLKNGILDVIVPKAKAPEARKISVQ